MKSLHAVFFLVLASLLLHHSSAAPRALMQCGEDAFEDNDSCVSAHVTTAPFIATGLAVYKQDPDYFAITVAPGENLDVDVFFNHSVADVELWIYDRAGPCGGIFTFLANSTSSTNDERVSWTNTGSTPVDVAVKVEVFPGSIATCNNYDLSITNAPSSSSCDPTLSDDSFEDNDSCGSAVPLPAGTTNGLWVSRTDGDYYSATLQEGETLDARAVFIDSVSDIDIFLYRASGPCGGGFNSGELVAGFTQTNNERIIWSNTSGNPVDVILHVDIFDADSCNNYALEILFGSGGIGTNFCQANANSTGNLGLIRANGSTSLAANNITLIATQLPNNQFGLLINSLNTGFIPNSGGSTGNLCLGSGIGRHIDLMASSGSNGTINFPINLLALPTNNGLIATTVGQDWKFQTWYRDTGAGGSGSSNLTNGIRITLTP